jgi:hypothetical protein
MSQPTIELTEAFKERLQAFRQTRDAFEQARTAALSFAAQVASQSQAAEAAEAEARGIKTKIRETLRQMMGKPSKQLRDLSADERAHYSLAEEYRGYVEELSIAQEEATLDAWQLTQPFLIAKDNAVSHYRLLRMNDLVALLRTQLTNTPGLQVLPKEKKQVGVEAETEVPHPVHLAIHYAGETDSIYCSVQERYAGDALWEELGQPSDTAAFNSITPMQHKLRSEAVAKRKQEMSA